MCNDDTHAILHLWRVHHGFLEAIDVVIRETRSGGKVLRFPSGEAPAAAGGPGGGGSAALQLSGDGRWAAMLVYPKKAINTINNGPSSACLDLEKCLPIIEQVANSRIDNGNNLNASVNMIAVCHSNQTSKQ